MFANWPVLINGTIILLFVNDADHMFISTQVLLVQLHETNIPLHCIDIAVLQCYSDTYLLFTRITFA